MVLKYVAIDLATKRQRLVDAPSSGGSATMPAFAATALSALRLGAYNADGKIIYASSANPGHAAGALGLILQAAAEGGQTTLLLSGLHTDPSWAWLLQAPIFLGIDGILTQTGTATGVWREVAAVINAQTIVFDGSNPGVLWR